MLSITGTIAKLVVNGGGTLTGTGNVGAATLSGGTIQAGVSSADGSFGTLTLASLTSTGGNMRLDIGPTQADRIAVTGVASFTNTTTFYPVFSAPPTSTGSITLLTAGTLNIDPGASLNASPPAGASRLAYHLATVGNSINLVIDQAFGNITWTGTTSNSWDVQTTPNWKSALAPTTEKYFDLDLVNFDSTSSVRNITLGASIQPTMISVNDATTYKVSGSGGFTGTMGFAKGGNGTFIVATTNNNYSGTTTVLNGTLQQGAANSLPSNMTVVLGDSVANTSGVLDLGGFDATVNSIAVAGTGGANHVTNSGATTATLNYNLNNGTVTLPVSLQDGGVGTGTLALAISSGTLVVANSNNTYSGTTTIANNATLQLGAGTTTGGIGSGPVANSGTLIFNRSDDVAVANVITGAGTLTKVGANTLTLSGSSSYTGPTLINGGTVSIGASNNLGDSSNSNNSITLSNGALQNTGATSISGRARSH